MNNHLRSLAPPECVIRQLEVNQRQLPVGIAEIAEAIPAEMQTPEQIEEATDAFNARVCTVEDCRLSLRALFTHALASGNEQQHREIYEAVAPHCALPSFTESAAHNALDAGIDSPDAYRYIPPHANTAK